MTDIRFLSISILLLSIGLSIGIVGDIVEIPTIENIGLGILVIGLIIPSIVFAKKLWNIEEGEL